MRRNEGGEKMEEKKEKKEMKISLWTFYVLVAALVILLASTVSGWLLVAKQKAVEAQLPQNNTVVTDQK